MVSTLRMARYNRRSHIFSRVLVVDVPLTLFSLSRLAPLLYKPEGDKIAERLWCETMNDLAPYGVAEIVDGLTVK